MSMDRHKRRAVVDALGRKHRRRGHRGESPSLAPAQFSLAALVLLVTLSSFLLAIFHYQGVSIVNRLSRDARNFPETTADEVVPLTATVVSLVAAAALGCLVARLHPDRGLYVVWFVTCLAALGLVVSLSLEVEPLAETKIKWLRREQIVAAALFCLSCLLPVGVGIGWYVKLTATR